MGSLKRGPSSLPCSGGGGSAIGSESAGAVGGYLNVCKYFKSRSGILVHSNILMYFR